jgi:5-methylcytosine-specific restriction endonuclease McrA
MAYLRGFWKPTESELMARDRRAAAANIRKKQKKKAAKKAKQSGRPVRAAGPAPDENFYRSMKWRQLRYLALRNTDGRCQACGACAADGVKMHVDHIKPRSRFPELALSLDNLTVLCEDCNIGKGSWDDTDWRIKMG